MPEKEEKYWGDYEIIEDEFGINPRPRSKKWFRLAAMGGAALIVGATVYFAAPDQVFGRDSLMGNIGAALKTAALSVFSIGDNKETLIRTVDLKQKTAPETAVSNERDLLKTDHAYKAASSKTSLKIYKLVISKTGSGDGEILDSYGKIVCDAACGSYAWSYFDGAKVSFKARPDGSSYFKTWSSPCAISENCELTIQSNLSVTVDFAIVSPEKPPIQNAAAVPLNNSTATINEPAANPALSESSTAQPVQASEPTPASAPASAPQESQAPPASQSSALTHVIITEIMVGDQVSHNDEFIELYNPTPNSIDLTGYSIKKKLSTGSETTILSASRLKSLSIPSLKHFLTANADYLAVKSDAIWPASYNFAYSSNCAVLYNEAGNNIDSACWDKIEKGHSYERANVDSSVFADEPNPNPQNSLQ